MTESLDPWLEYIKSVQKIDHRHKNIKLITSTNKIKQNYKGLVFRNDARIDLHGLTEPQAFIELKVFLENAYQQKIKQVLIITGKGKPNQPGIIKLAVPRWLKYTELSQYIISFSTAKYNLGGEGAIMVNVKSKRK